MRAMLGVVEDRHDHEETGWPCRRSSASATGRRMHAVTGIANEPDIPRSSSQETSKPAPVAVRASSSRRALGRRPPCVAGRFQRV
jgi:hypothetical protein